MPTLSPLMGNIILVSPVVQMLCVCTCDPPNWGYQRSRKSCPGDRHLVLSLCREWERWLLSLKSGCSSSLVIVHEQSLEGLALCVRDGRIKDEHN